MTIQIEQSAVMAARKHAMAFHSRNKIKAIDDLQLHKLSWSELNGIQADAAKEARALLDKCEAAPGEAVAGYEAAHDAFMALYDAANFEKDQRGQLGSNAARAHGGRNNRPGVDVIEVRTDGDVEGDAVYALKPEERFMTWAQARAVGGEYSGLSIGQYLRSMVIGGKTETERRALSEGSDSAGGYTVPTVLSAALIDLARAQSVVMRAGAQTIPLTSDTNNIAKLLSDPVPAWRAEAGAVAESDPTFGAVQLVPRSLAVQMKVSVELMEDSLNLATELPRVLAAAMAVELDRVSLLGSGTAPEPRGIANTVGIGTFAQNAEIATYGNLSKARTAILTANDGPVTAFIMHPRDEGSFTDLIDSNGNPLGLPAAVAAIPMLTTTSIPINGGSGTDESTIFAGNFAHLLVGIRQDIRVEVLKTTAYTGNLQYTLLAHMRADVAVTHPGAFYTLTGVGRAA